MAQHSTLNTPSFLSRLVLVCIVLCVSVQSDALDSYEQVWNRASPTVVAIDKLSIDGTVRYDFYTNLPGAALDVQGGDEIQTWVSYVSPEENLTSFEALGVDLSLWPASHTARPRPCDPPALQPPTAPAWAPLACFTFTAPDGDGDGQQVELRPNANVVIARRNGITCVVRAFTHELHCWGNTTAVPDRGVGTVPAGLGPEKAVSLGALFGCALSLNGGNVTCWGCVGAYWVPSCGPPVGMPPAQSISVGTNAACAVLAGSGNITCWGDPVDQIPSVPVGLPQAASVSVGGRAACAVLRDGGLACWGDVESNGGPLPKDLPPLGAVALGSTAICVMHASSGHVRCYHHVACAGLGCVVSVPPGDVPASSLSVVQTTACIITRRDGKAVCWLLPALRTELQDVSPDPSVPALAAITGDTYFPCGVSARDGAVVCWGTADATIIKTPEPPESYEYPRLADIVLGGEAVCGVEASNGAPRCWTLQNKGLMYPPLPIPAVEPYSKPVITAPENPGLNAATLLLGSDGFVRRFTPYEPVWKLEGGPFVAGATRQPFLDVQASDYLACGLRRYDRTIICEASSFLIAYNYTTPSSAVPALGMSVGDRHLCTVNGTGGVVCWGDGALGQTAVPPGLPPAIAVAAGETFSCAVLGGDMTTAGRVRCWGENGLGQSSPPADLPPVSAIAAGQAHACVISAVDGNVTCWGRAFYNDGSGSPKQVPPGLPPALAVRCEPRATCILTAERKARCWAADTVREPQAVQWQMQRFPLAAVYDVAGQPWRVRLCAPPATVAGLVPFGAPPRCATAPGTIRYTKGKAISAVFPNISAATPSMNASVLTPVSVVGLGAAPAPGSPGATTFTVRVCNWSPTIDGAGCNDTALSCEHPDARISECHQPGRLNSTLLACNMTVGDVLGASAFVGVTASGYDLGWAPISNPNMPRIEAVVVAPSSVNDGAGAVMWPDGNRAGASLRVQYLSTGDVITVAGHNFNPQGNATGPSERAYRQQHPSCVYLPSVAALSQQPAQRCVCNAGAEDFPGEGEVPPDHLLYWNDTSISFKVPPGIAGLRYVAVCSWSGLAAHRGHVFAVNLPSIKEVRLNGAKLGQQRLALTLAGHALRTSAPPGGPRAYMLTRTRPDDLWYVPGLLPWPEAVAGQSWPMARMMLTVGPKCFISQPIDCVAAAAVDVTADGALSADCNTNGPLSPAYTDPVSGPCVDWSGWSISYATDGSSYTRATVIMDLFLPAGLLAANVSLYALDASGALLQLRSWAAGASDMGPTGGATTDNAATFPLPVPAPQIRQVTAPALSGGRSIVSISGQNLRTQEDIQAAIADGWWDTGTSRNVSMAQLNYTSSPGPTTSPIAVYFMHTTRTFGLAAAVTARALAVPDQLHVSGLASGPGQSPGISCANASTTQDAIGQTIIECALGPDFPTGMYTPLVLAGGLVIDSSELTAHTIIGCAPGWFASVGQSCLACSGPAFPDGAVYCEGGFRPPVASPGWFALNLSDPQASVGCPTGRAVPGDRQLCMVSCEPPESCHGNSACLDGYTGVRCSQCATGYHRSASGSCDECRSFDVLSLLFIIFVLMLLGGAIWVLRTAGVDFAVASLLIDFWHMISLISPSSLGTSGTASIPKQLQPLFTFASAVALNANVLSVQCFWPNAPSTFVIKVYVAIMAPPVALLLCMVPALPTVWRVARDILQARGQSAQRSAEPAATGTGLSVVQDDWAQKPVKPRSTWRWLACTCGWPSLCPTHVSMLLKHTGLVRGFLRVLQFLYFVLVASVLSVWNCTPSNPPDPDGQQYLAALPYERCNSLDPHALQNQLLQLAIPALIFYVFGLPLAMAMLFWSYGQEIEVEQAARAMGTSLGTEADRAGPATSGSAAGASGKTGAIDGTAEAEYGSSLAAAGLISRTELLKATVSPLYSSYKPGHHWFSLINILRKAFVCILVLVFNKSQQLQLLGALLGLIMGLVIVACGQPLLIPCWAQETTAAASRFQDVIPLKLSTTRFGRARICCTGSTWTAMLTDRNNIHASLLGCAAAVHAVAAIWYSITPGSQPSVYYPHAAWWIVFAVTTATALAVGLTVVGLLLDVRLQVLAGRVDLRSAKAKLARACGCAVREAVKAGQAGGPTSIVDAATGPVPWHRNQLRPKPVGSGLADVAVDAGFAPYALARQAGAKAAEAGSNAASSSPTTSSPSDPSASPASSNVTHTDAVCDNGRTTLPPVPVAPASDAASAVVPLNVARALRFKAAQDGGQAS